MKTFSELKSSLIQLEKLFIDREYVKVQSFIQENYFDISIASGMEYQKADQFVYRMDVTSFEYSQSFVMGREALEKDNMEQFVLCMKIILVKLKANQRYTYFDREIVRRLLIEDGEENQELKEEWLENEKFPVGFPGMDWETYSLGSQHTIFEKEENLSTKKFEKEYERAVEQGCFYNYIVEIDHLINKEKEKSSIHQWIFLTKLLMAYYATEKKPWTKDFTSSLMKTYYEIAKRSRKEDVYFMAGTVIKMLLKKIQYLDVDVAREELMEAANFLSCLYDMTGDEKYLEYRNGLMEG